MKVLILNEDVFDIDPIEITVGNKAYKQLLNLASCGGFVRFTILEKEEIMGVKATSRLEIIEYLSEIFSNKSLLEGMF